jgi:hypothetical protein
MRVFLFLFLLVNGLLVAQPLTLQIDAVASNDQSETERIFTVKYHLQNNTADTLHFFFTPKKISPSTGGSMTKEIYYKIYENKTFIEIGQAFNQFFSEKSEFDFDETLSQNQRDSLIIIQLAKKLEENPTKLFKIFNEEGSIGLLDPSKDYMIKYYKKIDNYYHTLLPNQKEFFEATFTWNKNRYYYMEPNEYYLDENAKHYFELTLVAMKEEYKDRIDPEVYDKIMEDSSFIKGVFVSNKVEINFKPN